MTKAMTSEHLATIRARCEKITPGVWKWECGEYDCGFPCTPNGCGGHSDDIPQTLYPQGIGFDVFDIPELNIAQWKIDATFIASARADVLDLLKEVERLRLELGE